MRAISVNRSVLVETLVDLNQCPPCYSLLSPHPQLRRESDILHIQRALCLDKTKDQAADFFKQLITDCLKLSWSTQVNFAFHNLAH
jgi:hypothetical protein